MVAKLCVWWRSCGYGGGFLLFSYRTILLFSSQSRLNLHTKVYFLCGDILFLFMLMEMSDRKISPKHKYCLFLSPPFVCLYLSLIIFLSLSLSLSPLCLSLLPFYRYYKAPSSYVPTFFSFYPNGG